jgi:hypothetical protein
MAKDKLTRRQKAQDKLREQLAADNYPKDLPVPQTRLRFPTIPKNIEYFDVIKDKLTVRRYEAKEIGGIKWNKLGEKICEDGMQEGKYSYALKIKDLHYIYRGFLKAVNKNVIKKIESVPSNEMVTIHKSIIALSEDLKKKGSESNVIGVDYIMQSISRTHEAEIGIYKLQIEEKNFQIKKLENEIDDLEDTLSDYEQQLTEVSASSSTNNLLKLVMEKINPAKPSGLSEQNLDGIPSPIVHLIKRVDYSRLSPEALGKVITDLGQYIQTLPLK